jgi:hypothetical protein
MSDFLRVSPPEDGLVAAMATARARRYRKAGASSGFLAASLSCLALLAGSSGTQRLIQEPRPELPAVTGVDRSSDRAVNEVTTPNSARTIASFDGHATSRPAGAGDDQGLLGGDVSVVGPASPVRTSRTAEKPYSAGAITRVDNDLLSIPCDVATDRFCSYASVGDYDTSKDLRAYVCSTYTRGALLGYDTSNEVDFVVKDAKGKERWRWSRWHPPTENPHFLTVETGRCTYWSFTWTAVDASGRKLPQGSYTLEAEFLADELQDQRVATAGVTIG